MITLGFLNEILFFTVGILFIPMLKLLIKVVRLELENKSYREPNSWLARLYKIVKGVRNA